MGSCLSSSTRPRCFSFAVSLLAAMTFLLSLVSCGQSPPAPGHKVQAVATIFSYYDALRSIGGDDVDAVIILPPGQSPHEFEPRVRDKALTERAQLIIKNGLSIDLWMDRLAATNTQATVIDVSAVVKARGIQPLQTTEVSVTDATEPATQKKEEEDTSAGNPHIWLDPRVQGMAAESIRDALIKLDPAHTAGYTQRAAAYLDQLQQLDKDFQTAAAGFKQRDFIGFHSAYAYLARRYGLNQIASIEELPGEGPTPGQTVNIIKLIKRVQIKVIFVENALPSKDADMIVRETGVTTGVLQPLETYDDTKQTYVSLMRENLEALKKALN
jgi:zinc transport system substrate-binding protein